MKANLSYLLFSLLVFTYTNTNAQIEDKKLKNKISKAPLKERNGIIENSKSNDSISAKKNKEIINFIITHDAEGRTLENIKTKKLILTDKAHIIYNDIDLKAGKIIVDYDKNIVFAKGLSRYDSITKKRNYTQRPIFIQGNEKSLQDSILFNYKTRKALVYGVNTQQGEMLVYGERTKRVNDSTIYIKNIRFTTSNKKKPDYYISTNKAKLVPEKKIIVGVSNMVIADVPTPLFLPFAYFPLEKKRTSGFLVPSWGENSQGFSLQNGGYYFVMSDYMDLQTTGDIYSNGTWALNSSSNYSVRYKYTGSFSFRYQNLISSIKGFPDYSKRTNYNITWNHSQDSKLSPSSTLSAYVNLGSTQFYRESMNEVDAKQYLTNNLSSSINYSKRFVGTPFNMSLSLRHNQNSNTKEINMTLPTLNLTMDRQYPFEGEGGIRKNALQKIGITYNMNGEYRLKTNDIDFLTRRMWEDSKKGVKHSLRASTNLKLFNYISLEPNINYQDIWYFDRIENRYDPNFKNEDGTYGKIINKTINEFNRFNNYNGGVSLSTTLYGMFNINGKKLKAIRHTFQPRISWTYQPNLGEKYIQTIQKGNDPLDVFKYNYYQGIYGSPNNNESKSIGISINNTFEAKIKKKEEEIGNDDEEYKKINLLNNLSIGTNYNMAIDSLRWSNIRLSTGVNLLKNRVNININGNFDPYKVTNKGSKVNEFDLRLNTVNLSANFKISNKDFQPKEKKGKGKNKSKKDPNNTDNVYQKNIGGKTNAFAHSLSPESKKDKKKIKLYNSTIPWNISFIYLTNYSNDGYKTKEITSHTLGFSGNVEFSPKWKVGFSSGYDLKEKDFAYTRLNFSRDLDSFRFNFSWVPFGERTSYNFFIGIKSALLSDLKWEKNNPPDKKLY